MNGVILDTNLSKSLLSKSKKNKIQRQEALFSMLMYENVWIPNQLNLNQSRIGKQLIKEGLGENIPKNIYENEERLIVNKIIQAQEHVEQINDSYSPIILSFDATNEEFLNNEYKNELLIDEALTDLNYIDTFTENTLGLLKEVVFDYYKQRRNSKISIEGLSNFYFSRRFHPFIKHSTLEDNILFLEYNKNDGIENYTRKVAESHTSGLFDQKLKRFIESQGLIIGKNFEREKLVKMYSEKLFNEKRREVNIENEKLYFLNEYAKLKEIIEFSALNQLPVKTSNKIIPEKTLNFNKDDNSYRVYRFIIEEIEYMPKLDSIEDVLRLRGDKRIKQFKDAITHWSEILKEGNGKNEQKVRNDIKKANAELKNLGKYEKIGGFSTYIALPFIVIDLLTGFPAGSILTAISGAYQFKSDMVKKRNDWLMIGNRI